jgi:hypothetical protein
MAKPTNAKELIALLTAVIEEHKVPGVGAAIAVFDGEGCQTLLGLDRTLEGGNGLMDSALVLLTGAWVAHTYSYETRSSNLAGDRTSQDTLN